MLALRMHSIRLTAFHDNKVHLVSTWELPSNDILFFLIRTLLLVLHTDDLPSEVPTHLPTCMVLFSRRRLVLAHTILVTCFPRRLQQ